MAKFEVTYIYQKDPDTGWYWGRIAEFPQVLSQGKTLEELKENLIDALKLYLQTQSELISKQYPTKDFKKRKLQVTV